MASPFLKALKTAFIYGYGLFTVAMYLIISILTGYFFKKTTEKEALELQLARDRLWNLSKKWMMYSHQIHTLRNGFKFHYVCNDPDATTSGEKPLVIFIHGFPDSWAVWRHVLKDEALLDTANVVAVDLPGYGGSQSLEKYAATTVLENLTEFIIAMRAKYGIDSSTGVGRQRTIIVAHDWGCLLSMRLAADAPQLADRFILTNGPHIPLVMSNGRRRLSSALKMFQTFLHSPIRSSSLLWNAARSVKTVLHQLWSSGYVFVFQMPAPLVEYTGRGGNYSFLKLGHKVSYGKQEFTPLDAAECMASTVGPSIHEGETRTANGDGYADSVGKRAHSNFLHQCSYYRDGAAFSRWHKSVDTITSLHSIAQGGHIRHASSGGAIFDDGPEGALKASTTILWGKKDSALNPELCLDGMLDYLCQDSQVIELLDSGHFTPLERESRIALSKAVEWAAKGEKDDIQAVIEACYPTATVRIRK